MPKGKTSKQHYMKGKQRVNEKTPMADSLHANIYSLRPLKHPQLTSCCSIYVSIHLSITSFLFASQSLPFFFSSVWHQTSVVSTPFTQPSWPLGLLYSPARPLHTSQPAAICLFIRLRARLIWPLSRTVSILHRW